MADVTISFVIPEAQAPRVINALAMHFGYNPDVDGPKPAFVNNKLRQLLKRLVIRQEINDAGRVAGSQPPPDINEV